MRRANCGTIHQIERLMLPWLYMTPYKYIKYIVSLLYASFSFYYHDLFVNPLAGNVTIAHLVIDTISCFVIHDEVQAFSFRGCSIIMLPHPLWLQYIDMHNNVFKCHVKSPMGFLFKYPSRTWMQHCDTNTLIFTKTLLFTTISTNVMLKVRLGSYLNIRAAPERSTVTLIHWYSLGRCYSQLCLQMPCKKSHRVLGQISEPHLKAAPPPPLPPSTRLTFAQWAGRGVSASWPAARADGRM